MKKSLSFLYALILISNWCCRKTEVAANNNTDLILPIKMTSVEQYTALETASFKYVQGNLLSEIDQLNGDTLTINYDDNGHPLLYHLIRNGKAILQNKFIVNDEGVVTGEEMYDLGGNEWVQYGKCDYGYRSRKLAFVKYYSTAGVFLHERDIDFNADGNVATENIGGILFQFNNYDSKNGIFKNAKNMILFWANENELNIFGYMIFGKNNPLGYNESNISNGQVYQYFYTYNNEDFPVQLTQKWYDSSTNDTTHTNTTIIEYQP